MKLNIIRPFSLSKEIGSRLLLLFSQFLIFDLLWCFDTTFRSLSYLGTYVSAALCSALLLLPYVLTRKNWVYAVVIILLNLLLIANLMYCRTYNSAIPLYSYFIAGNLKDFLPSVVDSMRWYDILLLLSIIPLFRIRNIKTATKPLRNYINVVAALAVVSLLPIMLRGGFVKSYERNQTISTYTCVTPIYTVFGSMLYDYLREDTTPNKTDFAEIEAYLNARQQYEPIADSIVSPQSVVLILCESLESWVLEKTVEGQEITPVLNKILKEPTTLYAPNVLTQVKGGRSIDCQLMINAGLLPIQSGSFALRYPERTFFTLTKAMKEKHNSKALLFTSDRPIVWNQGRIAEQFGFDRIFSSKDWTDTDDAARKKRISDGAFLTQAVEKIKSDGLWSEGESAFLQFVTYSGHSPFTLPEKLQKMTLTKEYPEKLRDYIITSNYVDNSLGILLDYLRSRPDYKNMMIVIVGDHEGLAADRAPLCQSQAGRGLVSPKTYVPLIVVNSPVGMRYTDVMGQIDIYPTLLNLLHLDDYRWKGIGQSIVSSSKAPSAISPEMNIEGDTTNLAPSTIKHIKSSYPVSDKIIRFDYLRNDNPHDL